MQCWLLLNFHKHLYCNIVIKKFADHIFAALLFALRKFAAKMFALGMFADIMFGDMFATKSFL